MRHLSLVSFLAALLAWFTIFLWMNIPAVRATLWPSWLLVFAAIACSLTFFATVRPLGKLRSAGAALGLIFAALWILNFYTGMAVPQDAARPVAGATLPTLKVIAQDGSEIVIPTGKPTLLVFFRGFWCPACVIELRNLGAVQAELKARGGEILAISTEPMDRLKKGLEHYPGLPVRIARDPNHVAVDTLKLTHNLDGEINAAPANILLDADGKILWTHYAGLATDRPDPARVLEQVKKIPAAR